MRARLRSFFFAATVAVLLPLACGGRSDVDVDAAGGGGSGGGFPTGGSFPTGGGGSGGGSFPAGGGGITGGAGGSTGGIWDGGAPGTGALGGLGGLGGSISGDFYPDDIEVTTSGHGCWDLVLTAFTLEDGDSGLELFGAVRNDGDVETCAVDLTAEVFDASGESLGSATNILKHPSQYLYSIDDDTDTIVFCLGPGETAMGHLDQFPSGVALESVAHLSYRCPSLMLDTDVIDAAAVSDLEPITSGQGTAYTGVFENHLDVPISNATVFVFPTTASGRPLGMTTIVASGDVASFGTWAFETPAVDVAGDDQVAFPYFDNPL